MMSLVRAQLGEPKSSLLFVDVDDTGYSSVSIPKTDVKFSCTNDSYMAMRCENRKILNTKQWKKRLVLQAFFYIFLLFCCLILCILI